MRVSNDADPLRGLLRMRTSINPLNRGAVVAD